MRIRAARYQPLHADPNDPLLKRGRLGRGGVIVIGLYVSVIGVAEWRLQQRVAGATTDEIAPIPVFEQPVAVDASR